MENEILFQSPLQIIISSPYFGTLIGAIIGSLTTLIAQYYQFKKDIFKTKIEIMAKEKFILTETAIKEKREQRRRTYEDRKQCYTQLIEAMN